MHCEFKNAQTTQDKSIMSLKRNTIYHALHILSAALMPILVVPHVNRILGIENMGLYNFAFSAVSVFLVFAGVGLCAYSGREISKNREDKYALKRIYSSTLIMSVIAMLIVVIPFILMALFFPPYQKVKGLLLLFSIMIILHALHTEWLFVGLEKFKYIAVRSVILRTLAVAVFFIFVRSQNDLYIYATISIAAVSGVHILNFIKSVKLIGFSFKDASPFKTGYAAKFFFFAAIIASVYTFVDRQILGSHSTNELALFTLAMTISTLACIPSLVLARTVAPRLAYLYTNNQNAYKVLLQKTFNLTIYGLIFTFVSVFVLSRTLILFMGGEEFLQAVYLLRITSSLLIFTTLSVFINLCIAIPAGKERNTFFSSIVVAVIVLTLNIVLVRRYGALVSSIAITVGEIFGFLTMVIFALKQKILPNLLKLEHVKYVLVGIATGVSLHFIRPHVSLGTLINTVILFLISMLVFFTLNILISLITRKDDEIMRQIKGLNRTKKCNEDDLPPAP